MNFMSAFVAILGPPNVGKSTLLNRIVGVKLAIVSPKPQTTRNRILGIHHGDGYQIIFLDTPGIHETKTLLHKSMVDSALAALQEVDILLMLIEMGHPDDPAIPLIFRTLRQVRKPCLLAINKIDQGPRTWLLPIMEKFRKQYPFDAIIPISALRGEGVDSLVQELRRGLKPGPQFYPPDMRTDQPDTLWVAEIIREKIYDHAKQELPYASAVTLDRMERLPAEEVSEHTPRKGDPPARSSRKEVLFIAVKIHVEKDSQKRILIGEGGRMIKAIGIAARTDLEQKFGLPVYLDLFVTVEKNWTKDSRLLKRLGY